MTHPIDTDLALMRSNLARIEAENIHAMRVSAEHYLWLSGHRGTLVAIGEALGGASRDVSLVNVLDRARSIVLGLDKSVQLQSHYAGLLNQWDGGKRMQFAHRDEWLARLRTNP